MLTRQILVYGVLAIVLTSAMPGSSTAQYNSLAFDQYQNQRPQQSIVSRGAASKKIRPVQSRPKQILQGCRHLYTGGPKSVVPHTC
jgi:hypothetical protein